MLKLFFHSPDTHTHTQRSFDMPKWAVDMSKRTLTMPTGVACFGMTGPVFLWIGIMRPRVTSAFAIWGKTFQPRNAWERRASTREGLEMTVPRKQNQTLSA